MNEFIVLSNASVHELLLNLSRSETCDIRSQLAQSLEKFSLREERKFTPDAVVVTRPAAKVLFRPFTSSESVGIKIIVDPSAGNESQALQKHNVKTLHGILALCDSHGIPIGILNADEITGYRTAMSVMVPYAWRARTTRIVVFGAGKQALWHVRLAFTLRGEEIEHVAIINRSTKRGELLLTQLKSENEQRWKSPAEIISLSSDASDYELQLQSILAVADVVFCTTPSREPLFPSHYLRAQQTNTTGCYISCIGSWQSDMMELDPQLLQEAIKSNGVQCSLGRGNGVVIVDDRDECLKSSGEIIRSGLQAEQLVEAGEVLSMKATSPDNGNPDHWLGNGFVIYKSVGVSSTDLAISRAVLSLARRHGVGISITDF